MRIIMKKFVVCALLLGLMAAFAAPVFSWDRAKLEELGFDSKNMQWFLLDYGKNEAGVPFAISRKYYTNNVIKNNTIELLMSKFGISPEKASSLSFTEYGYEYNADGTQYAMTYLRHCDMLNEPIHETVYEGANKTFESVAYAGRNHAVFKAAAFALGKDFALAPKPKSESKSAANSQKNSTIPAKRIMRKKSK